MEHKHEISEELQMIAPALAERLIMHPFHVPNGYFATLPDTITSFVKNETSVSAGIALPYQTPADYFETLAASVMMRIDIENDDLAAIAPLLHAAGKKSVYAAPAGYFERPVSIPSEEKTAAKVVGLRRYSRWVQYAAAAMLAGVLVSGAFMFTDSKSYIRSEKPAGAVKLEQPALPGDSSNTEDIVSENTEVASETHTTAVKKISFSKKIESLSDDELQNYLEENASPEPIQVIEEETEGI